LRKNIILLTKRLSFQPFPQMKLLNFYLNYSHLHVNFHDDLLLSYLSLSDNSNHLIIYSRTLFLVSMDL